MSDAILQRATAALQSGNTKAAHALCTKVLEHRPKDPGALYLMGRTLMSAGRHEEATAWLERCLKLQPRAVGVHIALAEALKDQGRFTPALARAEKALKIDPSSTDALLTKTRILARQNRHDRVRALLDPLVRRGAETSMMASLYADALHRAGEHDAALSLLEKHLAAPATAPGERSTLGFLHGRILERRGRYDEAFDAYTAANTDVGGRDDPAAYRARVDAIIETLDIGTLARLPRAGHGLETPVLVVGMPRTGSTLIEQIIGVHPQAFPASETACLVDVIRDLPTTIGSTAPWPACVRDMTAADMDVAGAAYVAALEDLAAGGRTGPRRPTFARIVDKYLPNYENLGLATLIVPGAKIIDCRRNPVDTCLSCFAEPLHATIHPYACSLEGLVERYRQYERLMAHWHAVLPDAPLLTVHYEELVADQETESRRILDFIGLEWDDRCLRFYESKREALTLSREQVKQPVYRTSVKRADRFGERLDVLRAGLRECGTV